MLPRVRLPHLWNIFCQFIESKGTLCNKYESWGYPDNPMIRQRPIGQIEAPIFTLEASLG